MESKLLFKGSEWDVDTIQRTWDAVEKVASKYSLTYYPPQIEIITAEHMLNNYSTHALPVMWNHWSFGKSFINNQKSYREGKSGLAFEVVINSNPSVCYIMENNTATMQALVMAHAAIGHSHVFKNNYMFKDHTNAELIIPYLVEAKRFIAACEAKYGEKQVEVILDAANSLSYNSIDKTTGKKERTDLSIAAMIARREEIYEETYDAVLETLLPQKRLGTQSVQKYFKTLINEENLLKFIENNSPILNDDYRRILSIVRNVAQYFYPQMCTKVLHEGAASFWHYTLMNDLYEEGYVDESSMLEFVHMHSSVIYQPDLLTVDRLGRVQRNPYYNGINPYALGFAIFSDIRRMCENPDEEDKLYFPSLVNTDWLVAVKDAVENYRDDSFIMQFLSPKVARKFNLFSTKDMPDSEAVEENIDVRYHTGVKVRALDTEDGFYKVRRALSEQNNLTNLLPQIEVEQYARTRNETKLAHYMTNGQELHTGTSKKVINNFIALMGGTVEISTKERMK